MSEGDALLRAILEHPAEDTPRLMYADWLQERGQEQWAQFIRATRVNWHYVYFLQGELARSIPTATFSGYGREEEDPLGFGLPRWSFSFPERFAFGRAIWDRGFVSHLVVPLAAFMRHAEALFAAHPIERVTLTDKHPSRHSGGVGDRGGFWWEPGIQHDQPRQVPFEIGEAGCKVAAWKASFHGGLMVYVHPRNKERGVPPARGFETELDALSALSEACVAYGRSLAGLSPVPHVGTHA